MHRCLSIKLSDPVQARLFVQLETKLLSQIWSDVITRTCNQIGGQIYFEMKDIIDKIY